MTYRCSDCVYSKIEDKKTCEMECLKHKKTVKCMDNHCDDLILRPFQLLAHLSYAHNIDHVRNGDWDWISADQMAKEHLDKYGFAGMTTPDNIPKIKNREVHFTEVKIRETINTLQELMVDAHYGLPKEVYDIRFGELEHFIKIQEKYNKHFALVSKKEVEEVEK